MELICCFAAGESEATCNITIVNDAITESEPSTYASVHH